MSYGPLVKIKAMTAAEICATFELNRQARQLLRDSMPPHEFLEALMSHKQYVAGIDFMAHALPAREAIWWGCLCMQHACGDNLSAPERAASRATAQWVLQPTEENRAAAKAPAEAAGPASPAGALASATNLTVGNAAPPKASPTAPAPFASAKSVATAVKLASVKGDPAGIVDRQRSYFELGIGVAEGRYM
jgi:hypothetical protein